MPLAGPRFDKVALGECAHGDLQRAAAHHVNVHVHVAWVNVPIERVTSAIELLCLRWWFGAQGPAAGPGPGRRPGASFDAFLGYVRACRDRLGSWKPIICEAYISGFWLTSKN